MDFYLDQAFQDLDATSGLQAIATGLDRIDALLFDIARRGAPDSTFASNENAGSVSRAPSYASNHSRASDRSYMSDLLPTSPPPSLALENNVQYRRFLHLQDQFGYNIATRLITVLQTLVGLYRTNTWALYTYDDEDKESAKKGKAYTQRSLSRAVSMADIVKDQQQIHGSTWKNYKDPNDRKDARKKTARRASNFRSINASSDAAAASFYKQTYKDDDEEEEEAQKETSNSDAVFDENDDAYDTASLRKMKECANTLMTLGTAIEQTLDLLQGVLLLHAPSRSLFSKRSAVLGLLELLVYDKQVASQVVSPTPDSTLKRGTPSNSSLNSNGGASSTAPVDEKSLVIMHLPSIQVAAINTLVAAMVHETPTIRQFEQCDGVAVMCRLFLASQTPKDVKLRILEFLFFYLIPERKTRSSKRSSGSSGSSGSSSSGASGEWNSSPLSERKTTKEKANGLRKFLGNVDGLLDELDMSKPFGDLDSIEW